MNEPSLFFACVMAGGSGERFWPMSRSRTPKHLLKLFSDRTLLEETIRRLGEVVPIGNVFVLTNEAQFEGTCAAVEGLLPSDQIIPEPAKRDTAPAAALATALVRARGGDGATLALLPADAFIREEQLFGRQLRAALARAADTRAILTVAVKPDHPATGFGYLQMGEEVASAADSVREVKRFVEKPDIATAEAYLASGDFAWNAGMFCWRVSTFIDEAVRNAPELASFVREFPAVGWREYLAARFSGLPKISVDYAIMEKASRVETILAKFDWDDVGLWTAVPRHLPKDASGNAVRGRVITAGASNNIALSSGRTIALCGVNNLVVVETSDAVLVCHREAVQDIKSIVQQLPPELR